MRTTMSLLTGVVVWSFALVAGIELATAWGVIAFVLNYIPFLGPFIATVFPTLFVLVQTGSWQVCFAVFVCLNFIQFVIGSYLEPKIAGAALSMSPVHRPVRGVFLELSLGHCRCLYWTADHDRDFDDLRAAQVDGMDCVASLGRREKVSLMTSGRARLADVELVFAPVATDAV